jgi:hypothetical protein
VDEVLVVRVGELLGDGVVEFWEDEGCEGRSAGGGGSGVLSKDCGVVGNAGAVC